MNLATILEEISGDHRCATEEDIRKAFGDYHNMLRWLGTFLIADEKLTDACIVDACTIAQTQTPVFHEWLVHWAARATVRCALQTQHTKMTELALEYEKGKPAHPKHPPLSAENFVLLIRNSRELHGRLDILCRLVLVLRGIAKDSYDKVAAQLRISKGAVEQAYCVAFDTLELAPDAVLCNADLPGCHFDNDQRVTG